MSACVYGVCDVWAVPQFADTILKKYSSTVATIFTGLMSAALFGHELTINFFIGKWEIAHTRKWGMAAAWLQRDTSSICCYALTSD